MNNAYTPVLFEGIHRRFSLTKIVIFWPAGEVSIMGLSLKQKQS